MLPKDEDHDIGETHTRFAVRKREQDQEEQEDDEAVGSHLKVTACGLNETYVALRPIVFEECYAIDHDMKFINMVKRS